jgi:hypothetical protein
LSSNFAFVVLKFEKLDLSDYPDITRYDCPLDAGLLVLWVYKEKLCLNDYLSADQISEMLRARGVSIKSIRIARAFARAGAKVDTMLGTNKATYKIMQKGIDYLRKKGGSDLVEVHYIESDKPYTSHKLFKDIILKTKGEMKILDPYYGMKTLEKLLEIENKANIKFLTASLGYGEKPAIFSTELARFNKQYKNIEFRKYPNAKELHDRYIVTNDTLIVLGHGLKDLGGKESFVLVFKDQIGKDIRNALSARFDEKWQNS